MELKSRMTVSEMAEYMAEHTGRLVNRVSVGRYAKKLGYTVYKPMIKGKVHQYYINPSIKDGGQDETMETDKKDSKS